MACVAQIGIDVGNGAARANAFVAHMDLPGLEVAQQPDLQFVQRAEIGVPALRGVWPIGLAIPAEIGLAEAGPGRDHADGPMRNGLPRVEGVHVLRKQFQYAVGHRLQVVDQPKRG